jgi:predicted metal-dependent peptidase
MKAKQLFTDCFSNQLPTEIEDAYTAGLIIVQAKAWAYYSLLLDLNVIWTRQCRTAGTDGCHVYINPDFFLGLPTHGQRAFLLAHEVGHVIFRHPMRGKFYKDRGFHSMQNGKPLPFDSRQYNVAADYVINADLVAHGFEAIPEGLFHQDFGRDHLVDHVYIQVMAEQQQQQANSPDQSSGGNDESDETQEPAYGSGTDDTSDEDQSDDCGSGDDDAGQDDQGSEADATADTSDDESDGTGGGSEDESSEPEPSDHGGHDDHFEPQYDGTPEEIADAIKSDQDEIERKVDDALDGADQHGNGMDASEAMKGQGYIARGGHASSTDWRSVLADKVVRHGSEGDITFSRIHRRKFATLGIVAPTRLGTLNQMAFVVDHSGSVDRGKLELATLEVAAMIDLLQPASGCLVLFVDNYVDPDNVHEVFSGQELLDIEIPDWGGGTRMEAGVNWLEENGIQPDVAICFTDGYIPASDWPRLAETDTLVVLDREPEARIVDQMIAHGVEWIVVNDDARLAA